MHKEQKICEIKGAWLITWESHVSDEKEYLRRFGIDDKIIYILDSHKIFFKKRGLTP